VRKANRLGIIVIPERDFYEVNFIQIIGLQAIYGRVL